MHELLQDALPYLFAFYLLDGLVIVGAGQWLLARGAWGRYRRRGAGPSWPGLWPTGIAVRTVEPLVVIAPATFHVVRSGLAPPSVLRPDDLEAVPFAGGTARRDGRRVLWNRRTLLKAPSEPAAEAVVRLLNALAKIDDAGRLTAYARQLQKRAAVARVRARRRRYEAATRWLRPMSIALYAALFVAIPVLLLLGEAALDFLGPAVLAVLVLHVAVVWLTRRALAACGVRHSSVLTSVALFPPGAIHAPLAIAKELCVDLHPLAVAAAFLDRTAFEELAQRERHRLELCADAAAGTDLAGHWRVQLETLDRVVARAGADRARVQAAPARVDPAAAAYCPLCFTEYRAGFDECSDCRLAVRAF